jgi:F-type H+-transporting ATPase subunit b
VAFDWTTFALEVLNFLVLVWLLKRFLYRPVMDVIERRRADEEKTVADARALRDEAQALKAQYEDKLAHAAEDRERALARLDSEIAAERARRLAGVEADVAADRQRREAIEAREREQHAVERDRQAARLGLRLAARLLDRLASPAVEDQLVTVALDDLRALPEAERDALTSGLTATDVPIEVATAFALPPPRRAALTEALGALVGHAVAPAFVEDPALKAGVRIRAGAWLLTANLGDELASFAERIEHAG